MGGGGGKAAGRSYIEANSAGVELIALTRRVWISLIGRQWGREAAGGGDGRKDV